MNLLKISSPLTYPEARQYSPANPTLMLPKMSAGKTRCILVIEFNPYQILVAKISRPQRGPVTLETAAEFNRDDVDGLQAWIDHNEIDRRSSAVLCGIVPRQGFVLRENLHPRRLEDPEYLAGIVQEQQKGRYLTSTPFKVAASETWTLRTLSALDGSFAPTDDSPRPTLVCGIANEEIREVQQRLVDHGLPPYRIEPGLLSLFGAVYTSLEQRNDARAVVVIVIHESATAVYILGRKGVYTPNPVLHGFESIVELARKELGARDDTEVRAQLQNADRELLRHAAKLVWRIGRDLKPVVDAFEMETGQPAEEVLCAYLPPALSWIADPVARVAGRVPFAVDSERWMPAAGLQATGRSRSLGRHWLGALSLVANLPDESAPKPKLGPDGDPAYDRPWHVNCRCFVHLADHKVASRRLLTGTIAGAIALFAVAVTAWQLYVMQTLRTDIRYWEEQMSESRKLFDELTAATTSLKTQTAVLDRAYDLMGTSYQHSELILELGRTIPPRVRIDRIETNDTRVALNGVVLEPAEEASRTLGRYMEALRRNPAIGPLFSSITITSLGRRSDSDTVNFEITLRLLRP